MRKYRLVNGIERKTKISVCTKKKGYLQYCSAVLMPGVEYELPEDDPVFIQSLEQYTIKAYWTPQLESQLKENGIKYTVELCKSCGGRVKKVFYHPVEIFE